MLRPMAMLRYAQIVVISPLLLLVTVAGLLSGSDVRAHGLPQSGFAPRAVSHQGASNGLPYTYVPGPALTSVNPVSGPTSGANAIVLTGANLTGTTAVSFGGTPATSFAVNSATQITATVPGHAAGAVQVTATTPGGTTNGVTYTYVDAPTVTRVAPVSGPTTGGTVVTVTGTNLSGATAVSFGGTFATSFTVNSATQVTATAPAHAAGPAQVQVVTPGGTSSNATFFTYVAGPVLTNLAPASGVTPGGNAVVLTGTGLTGATAVSFGSTPAASFTVNSDTQITATAPAGSGAVQVTATTVGGTTNGLTYTYVPAPTVTSVTPTSGSVAGGTAVTIAGTNLTGASAVTFGGTAATTFTVDSATQITATTPPRAAGAAQVVVTTPGGTSSNAISFTFVSSPTVTSVSPVAGPTAGGTLVTIAGTNFTGATSVTFGGTPATSFTVSSATQITATVPAHAVGAIPVVVTTSFGSSNNDVLFTYGAAPTLSNLAPTQGPEEGGNGVVLTGANLTFTSAVSFDGTPATSFTVNSDTQVTATAPANAPGTVSVTVTTAGGTSNGLDYFYVPAPIPGPISPNQGSTAGGTAVILTGVNLQNASSVTFGGLASTINANIPTMVQVTTPAHVAGPVDVVITTPGGSGTKTNGYTYVNPPTITGMTPTSGPTTGGTTVTITGTNFVAFADVSFDGTSVPATINSSTSISAVTPANAAGVVDVVVISGGGNATAINGFTYIAGLPRIPLGEIDPRFGPMDGFIDDVEDTVLLAPLGVPALTTLTPALGPEIGGNTVVITGSGLTGATAVLFGATPATRFTVSSDTQITAIAPPGIGTVLVRVVLPDAPVITGLSPTSGPESGANIVTITGKSFTGATSVRFGSTAMSFTVNSDTQITTVAPGGTGTVNVTVVTPFGTSAPHTYTFLGSGQPPKDEPADKPKKETEEQRQQRERTNTGNKDDVYTEGTVVEVHQDENPPSIVIANNDGHVKVILQCGSQCPRLEVNQYVEVDGAKEHETLYYADEVTISR